MPSGADDLQPTGMGFRISYTVEFIANWTQTSARTRLQPFDGNFNCGKVTMFQGANPQHTVVATRKGMKVRVVATLLITAWSVSAAGQEEPSSADVAAARELAIEGMKLADAGHCATAIDKLARAEKLHHAPIVLGRLGECLVSEGELVEGTEALRKVLREPVPSNPPPALLKARERAQSALDGAKPKIASLTITIREPPEGVVVTVDGIAVPPALFDRSRPTDPGDHSIEVTAPGYLKAVRQVSLTPGGKQELEFKLVVDPQAPKVKNTGSEPTSPTAQPTQVDNRQRSSQSGPIEPTIAPEPPNHTASYVLWSVGAATAAAGGLFGYLAVKGKNDLDKQCPNNVCGSASQSDLDSAKRNALLSTILFGTSGAALAVGTVLYFVSGSPSQEKPQAAGGSIRAVVGLGSVGLHGAF